MLTLAPELDATPVQAEKARALRWSDHFDARVATPFRWLAHAVERHHPVAIEGLEHLPNGPALLVGNHGFLGYETLLFFESIFRETGRHARGLADRWFFRVPVLRDLLVRVGGAYGHPDNARRLLADGNWVVCYPGGAREALKRRRRDRYRLLWRKSAGFARAALEAGVPIVPFAAAGVDDTFDVKGALEGTGAFLMGHAKYDIPRLKGLGWGIPKGVPFLFRFGAPIHPEPKSGDPARDVAELHSQAWRATQCLLDKTVTDWRGRYGASGEKKCAP